MIPAVIVFIVILVWPSLWQARRGRARRDGVCPPLSGARYNWLPANRAAFELASLIQNDPKVGRKTQVARRVDRPVFEDDLDTVENPEMTQYVAPGVGALPTLDAVALLRVRRSIRSRRARPALDARYPKRSGSPPPRALANHASRLDGAFDDPRLIAALGDGLGNETRTSQMASFSLFGFFGGESALKAVCGTGSTTTSTAFVHYNAAVGLARRATRPRPRRREMLSSADLEKLIALESPNRDRHKVEQDRAGGPGRLEIGGPRGKPEPARSLRTSIDDLTRSGLVQGSRPAPRKLS